MGQQVRISYLLLTRKMSFKLFVTLFLDSQLIEPKFRSLLSSDIALNLKAPRGLITSTSLVHL